MKRVGHLGGIRVPRTAYTYVSLQIVKSPRPSAAFADNVYTGSMYSDQRWSTGGLQYAGNWDMFTRGFMYTRRTYPLYVAMSAREVKTGLEVLSVSERILQTIRYNNNIITIFHYNNNYQFSTSR